MSKKNCENCVYLNSELGLCELCNKGIEDYYQPPTGPIKGYVTKEEIFQYFDKIWGRDLSDEEMLFVHEIETALLNMGSDEDYSVDSESDKEDLEYDSK